MTSAPFVYVMKAQLNAPPYQDVTWRVYNTPDNTGAQSGYFGKLINIQVDYTIVDDLPGDVAVPINLGVSMSGDVTGTSGASIVNMAGDVTGRSSAAIVDGLQGRAVAATAPSNGQDLTWVSANNDWEPTYSSQQRIQIFTSSGTWTAPAGVTNIRVFGVGGGGGGEGGSAAFQTPNLTAGNGGSGGGGAWASTTLLTVVPGTNYTITIGAGGAGGIGGSTPGGLGAAGGNGGDTTFSSLYTWKGSTGGGVVTHGSQGVTLPTVAAPLYFNLGAGGNGGVGGSNPGGPNSTSGTTGFMHIAGFYTSPNGGGAGGAAGTPIPGPPTFYPGGAGGGGGGASNCGRGTPGAGGAGGNSIVPSTAQPGYPGGNGSQAGHGGGGGGGGATIATAIGAGGNGGNGGAGLIIITW